MNKIYAILDNEEGYFVSFGAKIAWARAANAKNAFNLHMRKRMDEQERYVVVELTEAYFRLEGLMK
jgi:hypothetical protein